MAMFQGTVIDAETIYLGMKIEEGFEKLAKAVNGSDSVLRQIVSAITEKPTPRHISALRDNMEVNSTELRAEIRALKVAVVQALRPIINEMVATGDETT